MAKFNETRQNFMNEKAQTASAPEIQTFNCSQKLFSAFCTDYGMDKNFGLRISGALGGGMRIGETCGVLLAALLVVGLKYGSADPADFEAKALCDEKERQVSAAFLEMYGCIACRDILGIDTSVGDNRAKAKELGLFRDICPNIIDNTIKLLKDLGY